MKIMIVQANPRVGDLEANFRNAERQVTLAKQKGADLVVFPELSVTGYPPKDLLDKPAFVKETLNYTRKWASLSFGGPAVLFGSVMPYGTTCDGLLCIEDATGKRLENVACLAYNGILKEKRAKKLLPTYDVFDEDRYFRSAESVLPMYLPLPGGNGINLGVCVCEDAWNCKKYWTQAWKSTEKKWLYPYDPLDHLAGADVIINLSASPFHIGKPAIREDMFSYISRNMGKKLIYCNQVGGNDDVVYDGNSLVFNEHGEICEQLDGFQEDSKLVDLEDLKPKPVGTSSPEQIALKDNDDILNALILGVRDYAQKTGFKTAVIGLSGGIDSTVVACIAAKALGPKNVLGVSMPSRYSSDGSIADAEQLAKNLRIKFEVIPIREPHRTYMNILAERMGGVNDVKTELWEENLQARIRGSILMAISNKENRLLLTTGNKSEISMGYFTLYGDSCGGLAVIADLFKTKVYSLARWINFKASIRSDLAQPLIPLPCIEKPPSAELRPGQKDEDSLPPYSKLDAMLEAYVEDAKSIDEIASIVHEDAAFVSSIISKVDRCEYKRKQLPPGIRVTKKAYGTGRQMPIAQGWYK
jgi:NAD+ synthase (glutamine-hydrolysing)